MNEKTVLSGFQVYVVDTGWRSEDDFAMTDEGDLLRKTADGYIKVPQRGEYIVVYAGRMERW